ncbi:MAG: MATE family efflux transporter [Deltaproteobacteria bacterium]|nr:MATE family efflux transporter [Deltaproteobacteria bacterium]
MQAGPERARQTIPDQRPETPARPKSAFARWRDRDHTRGNLLVSLGVLALPLMATSLFGGVVFQLVDLKLVSGLGEQAMTAVVVTNQSLRQLFFMLVMGASFGSQGLIARSIGEGNGEQADHVAGQTVLMGLAFSTCVATLGVLFPRELLSIMNVSDEVLAIGVPYVRLVFLLNFGFVFINLFNAMLNGAGDTATPFLIAMVQTGLALLGEWALIYGNLGMPALGISGVALGIGVGQVGSIALVSRVLFGGKSRVHVRMRHLRPDPKVVRQISKLSWPPALQMIGGFLVTVFFIRVMGDFGERAQAAYSIGLRLGMLGPIICFPLAGAVATLVGQALGAGNVRRAWRAMGVGILVHGALMWTLAILLYRYRVPFLELFTQNQEVIDIGSRMLVWQAGSFALLAFFFVFFRALQGAGDVFVPMLISLGNALLISLPLGLYLARTRGMGPDGLFIAQFVSTAIGTVLTGAWVATGRWTRASQPFAAATGP